MVYFDNSFYFDIKKGHKNIECYLLVQLYMSGNYTKVTKSTRCHATTK